MSESRTFESAQAFRKALDEHFKASGLKGEDLAAHIAECAYERLLARLNPAKWMVKGGCAVNLLSEQSRPTQDLDLSLREESLLLMDTGKRTTAILEAIREESSHDVGDFFHYEARAALPMGDLPPTALAAMVLVTASVAGEKLCDMRVDVGIATKESLPPERRKGRDLLAFAGIKNPDVVIAAKEEIFAEKLLAYSQQGDEGDRVRDLVDMPLLIDLGLDKRKLAHAIRSTCSSRSSSLPILPDAPPSRWKEEFEKLARSCHLKVRMKEAHRRVVAVAEPALEYVKRENFIEKAKDFDQRIRRRTEERDK